MTRKTALFEGWSWFKFNNLGQALGTNLKFYTSLSKGFKLKVRKLWGLIQTFLEVTGEKLVGGTFLLPPSWIGLKRLKGMFSRRLQHMSTGKLIFTGRNLYLYLINLNLYLANLLLTNLQSPKKLIRESKEIKD